VGLQRLGDSPRYVLTLGDRLLEVLVAEEAQGFSVQIGGAAYEIETVRGRGRARREQDQFEDGKWALLAPLTGVVIEVRVAVGDSVAQNDVLLVVEAMKMLNELRSRVAGQVTAVLVEEKQRVEIGMVLVVISET
jgi:biotin carboxyl carrier protein